MKEFDFNDCPYKTFSYETSRYPWLETFQEMYGIKDLENMHLYLPSFDQSSFSNDSSTLMHKIFYANFQKNLNNLYVMFLTEIFNVIQEPFFYQRIPCVRFGLPNTTWLTCFHTDNEYNHPKEEENINLAITDSYGSMALQFISNDDGKKLIGLNQKYGEFSFIDHINHRHGSITNNENKTLISIDFRIIRSKDSNCFDQHTKNSILQSLKFVPGHYFVSTPYSN